MDFRCIKDYDGSKYLTIVLSNNKEKDVSKKIQRNTE